MLYAGRAVYSYVHYFKDIRQGALQSDYVILFGGARRSGVGITRVGGSNEVVERVWLKKKTS